jgi:hypothetical protein
MTIGEEFVQRAGTLQNLHFQEARGRLKSLLEWMESQPAIQPILASVRRKADGLAIIKQGHYHRPPPANTPDEIIAVGLALMETCRERDLVNICLGHGIGPSYSTSNVQPYIDAGLQRFIWPLLVHIGRELDREDAGHVPARVADRKLDEILLGATFAEHFPVTHHHLNRIAAEFTRSDTAWQNIGNSCRQAMLEFFTECCAVLNIQLPEETKRGDVKAISRLLVQKHYDDGRFADSLATLVASLWDHTQSLVHRSATTRSEALRIYLWTGLTIDEIASFAIASIR